MGARLVFIVQVAKPKPALLGTSSKQLRSHAAVSVLQDLEAMLATL